MSSEVDDDSENGFANMVTCFNAASVEYEWIIDSGASDHMTRDLSMLENPRRITSGNKINLPNGLTSEISHCGNTTLNNGLRLKNVLHVADFKHNLLSVTKLVEDNHCKVNLFNGFCMIVSTINEQVRGIRKSKNGLYYLRNGLMIETLSALRSKLHNVKNLHQKRLVMNATVNPCSITNINQLGKAELWHYRMGHAPLHTLINIGCITKGDTKEQRLCVVCPMAKFIKLPYSLSDSYATENFQLIHMDI